MNVKEGERTSQRGEVEDEEEDCNQLTICQHSSPKTRKACLHYNREREMKMCCPLMTISDSIHPPHMLLFTEVRTQD